MLTAATLATWHGPPRPGFEPRFPRLRAQCFYHWVILLSLFLEAYVNQCGRCVAGTTGLAEDTGVDCKGLCSQGKLQIFDQLGGACLPVETNANELLGAMFPCDTTWGSQVRKDRYG